MIKKVIKYLGIIGICSMLCSCGTLNQPREQKPLETFRLLQSYEQQREIDKKRRKEEEKATLKKRVPKKYNATPLTEVIGQLYQESYGKKKLKTFYNDLKKLTKVYLPQKISEKRAYIEKLKELMEISSKYEHKVHEELLTDSLYQLFHEIDDNNTYNFFKEILRSPVLQSMQLDTVDLIELNKMYNNERQRGELLDVFKRYKGIFMGYGTGKGNRIHNFALYLKTFNKEAKEMLKKVVKNYGAIHVDSSKPENVREIEQFYNSADTSHPMSPYAQWRLQAKNVINTSKKLYTYSFDKKYLQYSRYINYNKFKKIFIENQKINTTKEIELKKIKLYAYHKKLFEKLQKSFGTKDFITGINNEQVLEKNVEQVGRLGVRKKGYLRWNKTKHWDKLISIVKNDMEINKIEKLYDFLQIADYASYYVDGVVDTYVFDKELAKKYGAFFNETGNSDFSRYFKYTKKSYTQRKEEFYSENLNKKFKLLLLTSKYDDRGVLNFHDKLDVFDRRYWSIRTHEVYESTVKEVLDKYAKKNVKFDAVCWWAHGEEKGMHYEKSNRFTVNEYKQHLGKLTQVLKQNGWNIFHSCSLAKGLYSDKLPFAHQIADMFVSLGRKDVKVVAPEGPFTDALFKVTAKGIEDVEMYDTILKRYVLTYRNYEGSSISTRQKSCFLSIGSR